MPTAYLLWTVCRWILSTALKALVLSSLILMPLKVVRVVHRLLPIVMVAKRKAAHRINVGWAGGSQSNKIFECGLQKAQPNLRITRGLDYVGLFRHS